MPRAKRKISDKYPYHISARCINRDWFKIPIDEVWEIFCDYLYLTKHAFGLEILSFVLMSNHFHMLVRTPKSNLSEAMNYFMREVSKEITRNSDRINQTFGGPYYASCITTNHYYLHAYKYVYRNPVEAGLCNQAEDYPYSTLSGLIGNSKLFIPASKDETLFSDFEGVLKWINTAYEGDDKVRVQSALKKSQFTFPKNSNSGYKDRLEKEMS
jgi:putative transposase